MTGAMHFESALHLFSIMKKLPYTPLQILIHLGAWFPFVKLVFDYFTNNLSPNPIQDFEQRTGFAAITLLILSLASTPLNTVFGWREPLKRRRALGLYAFFYATLHVTVYLALDYGFDLDLLIEATLEKRYTLIGTLSFLLLIPLAITSFKWWMRKLGKNWKRLHKLVYLIAPMAVFHFAWARKGDIFTLQGDVLLPFIYGLIALLLLGMRFPPLRKALVSRRTRGLPRASK
ncbi:MAG: hypothetical protein B6I38_04885 [Anaerolineaceae bacterium 4572_5.1]|nr:MAG: hypothetical protein B6I38_04885 [Anaerolineaceae bacterium 4572_5.1]